MTPAPQIPSHLRFMIAGIQDRALDLALGGQVSVKAELDITHDYGVFELVTRPGHCDFTDPRSTRITAELTRILGLKGTQPLEEALTEARGSLAAMADHLNALMDQEATA